MRGIGDGEARTGRTGPDASGPNESASDVYIVSAMAVTSGVLSPGVNFADRLVPSPEPVGDITVGFAGRLLDDKGIRPLVAAHRLLRLRGYTTRLLIAGTPDPANPTSVTDAEVEAWTKEPGIT